MSTDAVFPGQTPIPRKFDCLETSMALRPLEGSTQLLEQSSIGNQGSANAPSWRSSDGYEPTPSGQTGRDIPSKRSLLESQTRSESSTIALANQHIDTRSNSHPERQLLSDQTQHGSPPGRPCTSPPCTTIHVICPVVRTKTARAISQPSQRMTPPVIPCCKSVKAA